MRRGKTSGEAASSSAADQKPKVEFLRKEGWLDKLSPRSILKDVWQKRWVVLAEGEMCYYKDPESSPLGVIPLSHVQTISGAGNRVILSMLPEYSSREWKWRADSAHDAEKWREALEDVRAAASSTSEVVSRYSESGATDGKYWKRLDPTFKQQSLMAGRSHRTGSTAPGADRVAPSSESASDAPPARQALASVSEGVEVEESTAPRWARKRGPSQADRPKEVLYMEGTLTKLNKGLGQSERFYVLNGNKMTGYKNTSQDERVSTWFMEQLTSIEVVKTDGRAMLSLELNGVEQYELVGRSEEEIRQWGSKLAAAHIQFGGVLNISDMLHGPNKKSALYKQLEAQAPGQQSGIAIDLWCSNFDDKAGKDLKSFLDATPSLDSGLFAQVEAQLLPGTEITKNVMQSLHDCLYGVIVHFIDDWQMQSPAQIVALLDWLASYHVRLNRMASVAVFPDIFNLPSAKHMIDATSPFVSGPMLLPKGNSKFTKRWFSMKGSHIKVFESSEQEESGASPLQSITISKIAAVERDGKELKFFFPKEVAAKKVAVAAPAIDASSSRFPNGFVSDLVKRLESEKEDGTLPFDCTRPFPGYELVEWMCGITDLSYRVKRRDASQGLAQSLMSLGTIARADGGADWDEDVDYLFPFIEEESLDEFEVHAEKEDAAVVWESAVECVRRALTDKTRRRFGTGTPEIKTRFENEGQGVILDEVQTTAIDVFQKCDDLEDYLAGSQKLLDHAASYLDDLMFEEEFKACFDFVFDSFFTKAFFVIINYCKENHHHWRQYEFITLATWASNFEGRVLQYDESKLDMFNVVDQDFFVDLMEVYNEAVGQEIRRLISNLISEDIKAKSEPLTSSEGQLKSLAIVDLMAIYNQSLSLVIGTGNALVVTSTIKYTLPVLESFPKSYLQAMHASASTLPIEHVVSVLNAFYEGSHCIQTLEDQLRSMIPEKFFEQISFDGPSGAFNRAWKEGCRIVARVIGADVHPLIQKVGDKSWLNGSVTANWLATVRDYFGDLSRWMVPAVFRKLSADTFDDNLRCYVKALLAAKINIDEPFLERADADLDMIKEVFVEYTRINIVSARMGLVIECVELLACDYDDVRRGFMSLVLSTDINIGILEKILELRDCKRSVKKEILEECRGGWENPEASDDEATYALVSSGLDINRIPSGCEKFAMFSECGIAGSWPDWKERRDKERKDRLAALKARKETELTRAQELQKEAETRRREAAIAAHLKALEDAKRLAKERAREAENSKPPAAKAGASSDNSKAHASSQDTSSRSSWSRTSSDLSLSQIRGLQKGSEVEKIPIKNDSSDKGVNGHDAAAPSQANSGSSAPVKETMKEKIARQKREADLAAASVAPTAGDDFMKIVREAVLEASGAENSSGKETLKEKIARQKREADLAAAAPSTPTSASFEADSPMRARSDSSAGKETLKEKIARQKREAELAASSAYPALSSPSSGADHSRPAAVKDALKEQNAQQHLEANLAAMCTSEVAAPPPMPSSLTEQLPGSTENSSGKETLKEKIARQKREADLAAAAPSTPTSASFEADSPMRARSDSSAGKETLKEKIARAKREADLAASSPSSTPTSSTATPDAANLDDVRPRSNSSVGKETLKERIARQKLESEMSGKSPTSAPAAASPQQASVNSVIIGGMAARKGSTAFLRSIQRSPSIANVGDC